MRAFLFFLLIVLPVTLVLSAVLFWFVLDRPYGDESSAPVEIVVPHGMYFSSIASMLEDSGLIASASYTSLRYKIMDKAGMLSPLQAGRFSLTPGSRPSEVIRALTSPLESQRVYSTLVFPPGITAADLASRVENSGLAYASDVMDAIVLLAPDYPVKENPEGLQGYLFPDTYKIETPLELNAQTSRETARMLVRLLADQFFRELDKVDPAWKGLTRKQLHEKVTLASIVEREYRVPEEAPMIAAVFNNRLTQNMRLESCATVVYAIVNTPSGAPFKDDYLRFNRRIFEQYLDIPSDFNTYRHSGLPPGPICSPGQTALSAAFFPADTDALFFVVKNPQKGTHVFSRYYADHLNAREAYLNQFVVKE